jgi:hypothetical protein
MWMKINWRIGAPADSKTSIFSASVLLDAAGNAWRNKEIGTYKRRLHLACSGGGSSISIFQPRCRLLGNDLPVVARSEAVDGTGLLTDQPNDAKGGRGKLWHDRRGRYFGAKIPEIELPSSIAVQIMCALTRDRPMSSKNSCNLLGARGWSFSVVEKA